MICKPCAEAADWAASHLKGPNIPQRLGHSLCKGCDCQHRPAKEGNIKK